MVGALEHFGANSSLPSEGDILANSTLDTTDSGSSTQTEHSDIDNDTQDLEDSVHMESTLLDNGRTTNRKKKRKRRGRGKGLTVAATYSSKETQVFIPGEIFGNTMDCFLDTGSAVNLMSMTALQKAGQTQRIHPSNKQLKSFTGNCLPTVGEITTSFEIGGHRSEQTFIVCLDMDADILLGDPFLRSTDSHISYRDKTVTCGANGVPVPFKTRTPSIRQTCLVRWESTSTIQPNTVAFLAATAPSTIADCVGLVEPTGLLAHRGLVVASSISEVKGGKTVVKVVNVGDDPVRLREGAKIGRFGPVPDYQLPQGVHVVDARTSSSPVSHAPQAPPEWTREELLRRLHLDKIETTLSEQQRSRLESILWDNREIFSKNDFDIGCANFYEADIRLKHDHEPCWVNPIPVPYKLQPEMDRNIAEMQKAGVIEELDNPSDWNSPIFLVKKKTPGQYRLVCDLRRVNQECIGDNYPLPNLNHVLDSIGKDTLFSSLDLSKGFWQVGYTEESKRVTAFLYRGKQYCFARMIMGHKTSSAKFTRMMRKLLETLPIEQVIYFIDDVFLSSATVDQHLDRLEQLFNRFRTANLKISPDKTNLMRKEVEFVGINVSGNGIRITDGRVRDLLALQSPTTRRGVSEVLGAFNYIRKWVPNYSAISKPLHAALKGGKTRKFEWTSECENAYTELKKRVADATTLAVPDPDDPFQSYEVTIDASIHGLGATLSQELERDGIRERRIVAFYSKGLQEYKKARGQTRLEFEAMVEAIEHWRVYLANTPFTVITDCKSLLAASDSLFSKSDAALIRRTQILAGYEFTIRHIDGKSNKVSDFLSRFPHMRKGVEIGTQTEGTMVPEVTDPVLAIREETPSTPETVETATEVPEMLDTSWLDSCREGQVTFEKPRTPPKCRCDLPEEDRTPQVASIAIADSDGQYPASSTTDIGPLHTQQEWAELQRKDDILRAVIEWKECDNRPPIQANRTPRELFSLWRQFDCLRVHEGVLQRRWLENNTNEERWLTVVPSNLREQVMWRMHNVVSGHGGAQNTVNCTHRAYYWYKMDEEIKLFVQACATCSRCKQPRAYGRAAMTAVIYHHFNDAIIMDHIVPQKNSTTRKGHTAILTLTDAWSNFVIAVPVATQTCEENIKVIMDKWVSIFGLPREIINDNHKGFTGDLFEGFFKHLGVKVEHGLPHSCKSTARAESSNKRVNGNLRTTLYQLDHQVWDVHLPQICFTLNCHKNRRTGFTPFRLVFGREANISETLLGEQGSEQRPDQSTPQQVYQRTKELRQIAAKVRKNAGRDISYAKKEYDKKLYEPEYKLGDQVYIHIACPKHKYAARWKGPFLVTKILSPYLYKVRISAKEEKVFNISKMKKGKIRTRPQLCITRAQMNMTRAQVNPRDATPAPPNSNPSSGDAAAASPTAESPPGEAAPAHTNRDISPGRANSAPPNTDSSSGDVTREPLNSYPSSGNVASTPPTADSPSGDAPPASPSSTISLESATLATSILEGSS